MGDGRGADQQVFRPGRHRSRDGIGCADALENLLAAADTAMYLDKQYADGRGPRDPSGP